MQVFVLAKSFLKRKGSGEDELCESLLLHSETFPLRVHSHVTSHRSSARALCCAQSCAGLSMCEVSCRPLTVASAEFCSWYPGTSPWEKVQEGALCKSGNGVDVGVSNLTLATG